MHTLGLSLWVNDIHKNVKSYKDMSQPKFNNKNTIQAKPMQISFAFVSSSFNLFVNSLFNINLYLVNVLNLSAKNLQLYTHFIWDNKSFPYTLVKLIRAMIFRLDFAQVEPLKGLIVPNCKLPNKKFCCFGHRFGPFSSHRTTLFLALSLSLSLSLTHTHTLSLPPTQGKKVLRNDKIEC